MKELIGLFFELGQVCILNSKKNNGGIKFVFDSKEEFEELEASICVLGNDGCNNVMIKDGVLGGMTMKYCDDIYGTNGGALWSCIEFSKDSGLNKKELGYIEEKQKLTKKLESDLNKIFSDFEKKINNIENEKLNELINQAIDFINNYKKHEKDINIVYILHLIKGKLYSLNK